MPISTFSVKYRKARMITPHKNESRKPKAKGKAKKRAPHGFHAVLTLRTTVTPARRKKANLERAK
jgi:hypothetical protein